MPKTTPLPDNRDELLALARRIIRDIEWSGPEGRCPRCHRLPVVGHANDCPVGRVLASDVTQ